jgi:hypothetical protein
MLRQDGFFDEGSDRGTAPKDWIKTPGNAVIVVKAKDDSNRQKIKTRMQGVERIDIQLDKNKTGLVTFDNNMAYYQRLKSAWGKLQYELQKEYTKDHPGSQNTKDGFVTLYIPKKYQPATVSYGASGPSIKYPDLAYHHNISFLQLRRVWNFCVAYGQKKSDPEPLNDLIVNLLNLEPGMANHLAKNFLSTPGAVSADHRTLLFDRITWMGWNLVEGPPSSHRHDDPAESFDDFDTPYLDPIYSGRMTAIKTLAGAIDNMTRQVQADKIISASLTMDSSASKLGGETYQATVNSLRTAFQGIKSINKEPLMPFDPEMWEYVKGSADARFQLRK